MIIKKNSSMSEQISSSFQKYNNHYYYILKLCTFELRIHMPHG